MILLPRLRAVLWLLTLRTALAIEVDWESEVSIKSAAKTMADGMLSFYYGDQPHGIPGVLGDPYYWWESGAMFGALINYWHYTGDTAYNDVIMQAMQHQVGAHADYRPLNHSKYIGNDDQAFWAISALQAAEYNFPNPPPGQPGWLALVQAVFNEQRERWDPETCGGGLRWQILQTAGGYHLKNTISNGCFFNIAARLARYTNDGMYAEWANKAWDFMERIKLIDKQYNIFDNAEATNLNCTELDRHQWSYNAGVLLMGAATMYNITNGTEIWRTRTEGLVRGIERIFFPNSIMTELCEKPVLCDVDQKSFKAYLSRWMSSATQMAPFTYDNVTRLLTTSAKAAAAQCTGPDDKCGLKWDLNGTWDGTTGVGEQMAALEVTLSTLVKQVQAPVTNSTGGTSIGNPTAGFNASDPLPGEDIDPVTKGDKIGAWFLTVLIILIIVWSMWFMWSMAWEPRNTVSRPRKDIEEKVAVVFALGSKGEQKSQESVNSAGVDIGVLMPIVEDKAAPVKMGMLHEEEAVEEKAVHKEHATPKYKGGNLET